MSGSILRCIERLSGQGLLQVLEYEPVVVHYDPSSHVRR